MAAASANQKSEIRNQKLENGCRVSQLEIRNQKLEIAPARQPTYDYFCIFVQQFI
jgi:hypothetical protein